jgi:hypothetical protein
VKQERRSCCRCAAVRNGMSEFTGWRWITAQTQPRHYPF